MVNRERLYQLISIEDESERETALEEIANEFTTYANQVNDLTVERDGLLEANGKLQSDLDTYKTRLARVINDTANADDEDDEEVIDWESRALKIKGGKR